MDLTRSRIFGVGAGGRGAVIALASLDLQPPLTVAIIDRESFWRTADAFFNNILGYLDLVVFDHGPGILEQLERPAVENLAANLF